MKVEGTFLPNQSFIQKKMIKLVKYGILIYIKTTHSLCEVIIYTSFIIVEGDKSSTFVDNMLQLFVY